MKALKKICIGLLLVAVGFFIGSQVIISLWKRQSTAIQSMQRGNNAGKVGVLISSMRTKYVDHINVDSIIDLALPQILKELDPHSAYYPAEETKESNDELHGSFSGIGIQFSVQDDTVRVNSVIHGGPSEKVGVLAGDKIITINDSVFAGKKKASNDIVKNLKGPSGTEVRIGVMREGEKNLLEFTIERAPIPVKSVDAAYIIPGTDHIGYILINKFGETTYNEMLTGLAKLKSQGMKGVVIDLRGNTGGYLVAAIRMVNEFLPKGDLIVYTEGVHSPRASQYADGRGQFKDIPMAVLIDETSASASEIFTGAIQDNDRGIIVGRRSYGKGLVQEPIDFVDGSSIRLTIARYYTPSGRCIQKPYGESGEDYAMDIVKRYEHGEFFSADSVKQDQSLVYKTKGGREVYGGGGIMPDYFVAQDTTGYSAYYETVVRKSLVNKFSFRYVDRNRSKLAEFTTSADMAAYLDRTGVLEQFYTYAAENGVKRSTNLSASAKRQMRHVLLSNIIYDAMEMDEYVQFFNTDDPTLGKAIEVLKKK